METRDRNTGASEIQADIYRFALSLDSLLVNGIQYGVLQAGWYNGFVEKLSATLLNDLEVLGKHLPLAPVGEQQKASETIGEMRFEIACLIDLVVRLISFRSLSSAALLSALAALCRHRQETVRLIGDLEKCYHTPKPFYANRPHDATLNVDAFLAGLPAILEFEKVAHVLRTPPSPGQPIEIDVAAAQDDSDLRQI